LTTAPNFHDGGSDQGRRVDAPTFARPVDSLPSRADG
jgi:hypothetical protein